jgi:hypothetical protein
VIARWRAREGYDNRRLREIAQGIRGKAEVDIDATLKRLRHEKSPVGKIEDVLYERQDLLRFLPGIARQGTDATLRAMTAKLLRSAARLRVDDQRPEVVIAFARFQESVFRTIDTSMRRHWSWTEFDDVVAAAVRAIPRTMTGTATVCNALIRATIAILRTAIRLVRMSDGAAETRNTIAPFFEALRQPASVWANHGIAEGCYRVAHSGSRSFSPRSLPPAMSRQ